MHIHKIADVLFFIKSIKHPSGKIDILNFYSFTTGTTRSANSKFYPTTAHINPINYELLFLLFTQTLCNALPIIDLRIPISTFD